MQKILQPHLDPNLEIPRCGRKVPEGFADTVRTHLSVRSSCGALWGTVGHGGADGEFMGETDMQSQNMKMRPPGQ